MTDLTVSPTALDLAELRDAVRARYSAVAKQPVAQHPFKVGRAFAEALGYPKVTLDGIPESSAAVFTGVAAPVLDAALESAETVLDLGCGGGLDLIIAANAVGPAGRAIGVDMATPMVARAIASLRSLELTWSHAGCAHAEALPFGASSFDCVVANGILNLAPSKAAILEEVARVLRPGGRFLLAETTLRYPVPPESIRSMDDWFR